MKALGQILSQVIGWALLVALPSSAQDWPQFRGPERNGIATTDAAWPPSIVWQRAIGEGFSAVTVVGDAIYSLEATDGHEHAVSFSAADGEERWRRNLGPAFEEQFGNGPRSTPAVADGTVYALSSHGRLAALDVRDGSPRWQIELPKAVGGEAPRFGYSPSPMIDGDLLLLEVGAGDGHSIVALDRSTGELRWSVHSDRMGYSSPIVMQRDTTRQYVFVTATAVVGLSMMGEVRWQWDIPGGSRIDQPIAMPVPVAEDRIFVAHRGDGGSALLDLSSDTVAPVWENRFFLNHLSSSVAVDGHLYGFHNAILKCLDAATGRQCWAKRGLGKGSLVAAGDLLLVLADDGELVGVRATPESYQELGRLQALDGRAWTAPAMAGRSVYLRNHEQLVRLDLASSSARTGTLAQASTTTPSQPQVKDLDIDDLLAAHFKARGGERLREVNTLRIKGRYAENSVYSDFVLLRQAPDGYRFEQTTSEGDVVKAVSGKEHWLVEASGTVGPLPGGELRNLRIEADLLGPLVDTSAKGHAVELVGRAQIDGGEAWQVEIIRRDGGLETWYLDPKTFLARERHSRYHAYGEAWNLRTYYSDYRKVEGILLPHLIESEFSSLHRLMRIETVEINPQLTPDTFRKAEPIAEKSAFLPLLSDSSGAL